MSTSETCVQCVETFEFKVIDKFLIEDPRKREKEIGEAVKTLKKLFENTQKKLKNLKQEQKQD